jgi:hypothetical protein
MLIADEESRNTTHVSEKIVKGKIIGNCSAGKSITTNKATGNIFREKMINKIRTALVINYSFLV